MRIVLFPLYGTDIACLRNVITQQLGSADIEIIDYRCFGMAVLLKHLREATCDILVLGVYNINLQQRLRLWKAIALMSKARRRLLIDQDATVKKISRTRFLFLDFPHIITELILSPILLAKHWLKLKYERSRIGHDRRNLNKTSDALKIAYLRTLFEFNLKAGGSVGHTAGVISGLMELGNDVFCISTDELFGVDGNRVPIHIVCPSRFTNTLLSISQLVYNRKFIRNGLSILNGQKPDLIYQRYTIFNYSGAALARYLNLPFALEFNSSEVWKAQHWLGRRNGLLPLIREIETFNLETADLVVVVSGPLKEELIALGIDREKILVNPNAVDLQKFRPEVAESQIVRDLRAGMKIDDGRIIVGFSGTFDFWHGVPQLTEAIDKILGGRLCSDICFLLIGDGRLKPNMERDIGHYEDVIFTGRVPYSDIQYYLALCDVFVSPHSPQIDGKEFFGSPTKLYEYMAMGKGIVASNLGQIGQVLENEKTAILVEPGNAEQLIDGILKLVQNKELRERLGLNARKKVSVEHTWKRNAERVLERLYIS